MNGDPGKQQLRSEAFWRKKNRKFDILLSGRGASRNGHFLMTNVFHVQKEVQKPHVFHQERSTSSIMAVHEVLHFGVTLI